MTDMFRKHLYYVAAFTILSSVLYIILMRRQPVKQTCYDISMITKLVKSRNSLSSQLNTLRKHLGQMECKIAKMSTSDRGGWCKDITEKSRSKHNTDKKLIPVLSEFLRDKNVASFGDGQGVYKREMLKLAQVKSYTAYDGAPFCEQTSEGEVIFMDLSIPQYGIPVYDWILSLEVAEHIPERYETIYLDNLCRHASGGIILSWAVPGQGGIQHVNNKPLNYVVKKMKDSGFNWNIDLSKFLQSGASFPWLKNNLNVFYRNNTRDIGSKFADIYSSA